MRKRTKYIAYGSNMNVDQMADRCPDATVYAVGELEGWQLTFMGRTAYGGFATIVHTGDKRDKVPVLIWDISPMDERNLDFYEGYPRHYRKENVLAKTHRGEVEAMVYIMAIDRVPSVPTGYYVESIKAGYLDAGLSLTALKAAYKQVVKEVRKSKKKSG